MNYKVGISKGQKGLISFRKNNAYGLVVTLIVRLYCEELQVVSGAIASSPSIFDFVQCYYRSLRILNLTRHFFLDNFMRLYLIFFNLYHKNSRYI